MVTSRYYRIHGHLRSSTRPSSDQTARDSLQLFRFAATARSTDADRDASKHYTHSVKPLPCNYHCPYTRWLLNVRGRTGADDDDDDENT